MYLTMLKVNRTKQLTKPYQPATKNRQAIVKNKHQSSKAASVYTWMYSITLEQSNWASFAFSLVVICYFEYLIFFSDF